MAPTGGGASNPLGCLCTLTQRVLRNPGRSHRTLPLPFPQVRMYCNAQISRDVRGDCTAPVQTLQKASSSPHRIALLCMQNQPFFGFHSAAAAAPAKRSAREEASQEAGGMGGSRSDSLVDVPVKPKPRKFFDAKTFRQFIKMFKDKQVREEDAQIRQQYARPPPEGWDAAEFAKRVGLEEAAEAIKNHFTSWGHFVCATPEDLMKIEALSNAQRRLLLRHLRLFNNGLWPENSYEDYLRRFQAEPLKREGFPWTEEEDATLLDLAEKYDVNFGDPWLYISWEMQRPSEDVHRRYLELVEIPRNKKRRCEFVLSKCMRPLYFSRYFKVLPPNLLVVPSPQQFSTEAVVPFVLPAPFECFQEK